MLLPLHEMKAAMRAKVIIWIGFKGGGFLLNSHESSGDTLELHPEFFPLELNAGL